MAIVPDTTNILFQLAADMVNQSSRNIFLTGKAGTGKTTFLKYIRENCPKQMATVAPTGVAAINAGGVTIHSFFQLPISPFIPESQLFSNPGSELNTPHNLINRLRINTEKKKVFEELELLVIDEISMVRADTIDAIDTVLRHVRQRHNERFGGVQLLLIGDMFQLSPVARDHEWKILAEYYNSPWFFDSRALKEELPVYIEFDKIYRQSEEQFIFLLNQLRNNELDNEGMKILESRFQPAFRRTKHDGYIILTTHNDKAKDINAIELQKTDGELFSFKAEIFNEFSENAYPAEEILQMKPGAQVMFIKNDPDKTKRYFNGKIGIVTSCEKDKIFVQCKDEPSPIEVKKEKWQNIRYVLNKETRKMDEVVLGSFSQFPLRLAWAITIHKSQGLTFEKAIIDVGEAFAAGQVYVALSRCTNLAGMVLQSRIRPSGLITDNRIKQFSKIASSATTLQKELATARENYSQSLLIALFDFSICNKTINEIIEYVGKYGTSFNPEAQDWLNSIIGMMETIQDTASKFQSQVKNFFIQQAETGHDASLQERIKAASKYFMAEIGKVMSILPASPVVTDNRLHAKDFNDSLREVFSQLSLKKFLLEETVNGFSIDAYLIRKANFVLPPFSINAYGGASDQKRETAHPALHYRLRKVRESICAKKDIPLYIVAGSKTIDEMVEYLPQNLDELKKISGFGKIKIEQYGKQFLEVIQEYCIEHDLKSTIDLKKTKSTSKADNIITKTPTKEETYRLYKEEGRTIVEIALIRKLTPQTIEGHLSFYVEKGIIAIDEVISYEKRMMIEPVFIELKGSSLTSIKQKLGNSVTFGEIRLVQAWMKYNGHTMNQVDDKS